MKLHRPMGHFQESIDYTMNYLYSLGEYKLIIIEFFKTASFTL